MSLDGLAGTAAALEELLFKTPHGIVDQSLHARLGAEPTNGDGFGLGWYDTGQQPCVYRSLAFVPQHAAAPVA